MTKEQQKLKDQARGLSLFWHKGAVKGTNEQVGNQLDMLKAAAVNVLAQHALNKSKPECYSEPVPIVKTIMELKDEIEDEIKYLEKSKVTFHSMREKEKGV